MMRTTINIDEQLLTYELELIRACLHSGTPLGNDHFKKKIESAIGNRVGYSKRGRPAGCVIDGAGLGCFVSRNS